MRHLLTKLINDANPGSGFEISNKIVEVWSAGRVKRYHIHHLNSPQSVADHTFGVAAIVSILWPYSSVELLRAAIFHDIAEKFTGDMPGPVKREYPELKKLMDDAERVVMLRMGLIKYHEDSLSPEDRKKLKAADYMEALLFCIAEETSGNRHISYAITNCYNYICEIDLPEATTVAEILMMHHRHFMGGE
jgi:5'-deoxynucleotidase